MELKEGMYVRTIRGKIAKLIHFVDDYTDYYFKCWEVDNSSLEPITESDILKASFNVTDLLEENDIIQSGKNYIVVTQEMLKNRDKYGCFGKSDYYRTFINKIKIDKILIKEQFEIMSYKV